MESTEQLYFMAGAACVLWAQLIARGVILWHRHRYPRRATYTPPPRYTPGKRWSESENN